MVSHILVIVPDLPPNVNGVGDYSILLAKEISSINKKYQFTFLVAGNIFYDHCTFDGFQIQVLKKKSSSFLFKTLTIINPDIIHLHYVGYGYDLRGTPFWLNHGLHRYFNSFYHIRLVTTFHELYASSFSPFTSSFWNQFFQRKICFSIANLSFYIFTNSDIHFHRLCRTVNEKKVVKFPVFSNFLELKSILPQNLRDRVLVVIGSCSSREYIYRNFSKEILYLYKLFKLHSIIDIGDFVGNTDLIKSKSNFIQLGKLDSTTISFYLSKSFLGVIGSHSSSSFAKSGVFAAYVSHGVLVVSLNPSNSIYDGLYPNIHFLTLDFSNACFDFISANAFNWYKTHTLGTQAFFYDNLFMSVLCSKLT